MKLKSKILILPVVIVALLLSGCQKFLTVDAIDKRSGNNYWLSVKDYDEYALNLYQQFRLRTLGDINGGFVMFFPVGDFRCGWFKTNPELESNRYYCNYMASNNLIGLTTTRYSAYHVKNTDWSDFIRIVASCNILLDKVENQTIGMSKYDQDRLKGEAVFMRSLVYFFMARLYGDIPYDTKPFNSEPVGRMNMVKALNNCLQDLKGVMTNIPWTYDDYTFKGVRAQKGGALALMMHINMWCAGFDTPNRMRYYTEVDSLGDILLNQNGGVHRLLPLDSFRVVSKGGSPEGLFEVPQSLNRNERFSLFATFADNMLTYPHKRYAGQPGQPKKTYVGIHSEKWFEKMFPTSRTDGRRDAWFNNFHEGATPFTMECLKFTNVYAEEGEDVNPDDCQMVFRLPDAMLLKAEACAELGKVSEAIDLLNEVRARAHATPYADGEQDGMNLSDIIFLERVVELFGEGHLFYDLVRTKRVLNNKFTPNPMGAQDFAEGGWTWPISSNALTNNPYMTLNDFWRK